LAHKVSLISSFDRSNIGCPQLIPSVAPLANSLFHYQPNSNKKTKIRLEATYQAADQAVQNVVDLLAA
jgi:hypothetical protein